MAVILTAAGALGCCRVSPAAEPAPNPPAGPAAAGSPAAGAAGDKDSELPPNEKLAAQQRHVAERYKRLEEILLRMAELNTVTDPRRAALLKKAAAQSKEKLIDVRFEQLAELLGKDQLSRAIDNQADLNQDLRALLDLLMSENRAKQAELEKARVREYLKQVNEIIRQEKDIQGRTVGGDEMKGLSEQQGKVADKTGGLARDMHQHDQANSGSGRPSAGDHGEKQPGEQGKEHGRQSGREGQPQPGGAKQPGSAKQPQDQGKKPQGRGNQPNGQPDSDENGRQGEKSSDDSPANPARQRLEAAQQRMREAEAKLKDAGRQGAADKEEEALRELQKAKAELEDILRQLREEQIARMLAMLEARFRKMLQMEEEVYEGTVRLDRVPAQERTHSHEIEASRVSGKQLQVIVELDKALQLLREDGTAVAFPEALGQARDDMQQVTDRLAQVKVDKITQGIEEDILAALREMVQSLKQAQRDAGGKKKKQPGQAGGQDDRPLIDSLAELRMIRALQMRVNTRTARYAKMVQGEQAGNSELVEALQHLAEREQRIYGVTRDLGKGKNQ
jgi:hypothetical protein